MSSSGRAVRGASARSQKSSKSQKSQKSEKSVCDHRLSHPSYRTPLRSKKGAKKADASTSNTKTAVGGPPPSGYKVP